MGCIRQPLNLTWRLLCIIAFPKSFTFKIRSKSPSHKKFGVVRGSQLYERVPSIRQVWTLIVTTFASSGPNQEFDEDLNVFDDVGLVSNL